MIEEFRPQTGKNLDGSDRRVEIGARLGSEIGEQQRNGGVPDVIKKVSLVIEVERQELPLFYRRNRYDTHTSELIYTHISRRLLDVTRGLGETEPIDLKHDLAKVREFYSGLGEPAIVEIVEDGPVREHADRRRS